MVTKQDLSAQETSPSQEAAALGAKIDRLFTDSKADLEAAMSRMLHEQRVLMTVILFACILLALSNIFG